MSLDFIEEKIDGIRTEAEHLREGYAHVQAEVAADPNLTDVGKWNSSRPSTSSWANSSKLCVSRRRTS